jgi:GNAT superfamily N-acetyltransferase
LKSKAFRPTDAGYSSAPGSIEETNRAVLARFVESWAAGDVEGLMACVTETFIYRASIGPEPGKTYSGAESVRAGIAEMRAIDAGRIPVVTDQNIHGNRGYVRWIYRWPSTDMVADEAGCDWIQFRDGLLDRKDSYRKVRQHPTVPALGHLTTPAPAHSARAPETIRFANAGDAQALLQSMERLAEFEGYKADFRVTTQELLARGLAASQGQEFRALVADCAAGGLCGYAVVQEIPFTFDLRPTLVLKELFVAAADRSRGVGTALMEAVIAYARRRGCGRLRWLVLPGNDAAKRFYERFGGATDSAWENWVLNPSLNSASPDVSAAESVGGDPAG